MNSLTLLSLFFCPHSFFFFLFFLHTLALSLSLSLSSLHSATETIRQMKAKVTGMDEEMKRLTANMQNIQSLSDGIANTLAPRRERILKLSSGHLLLKKLQFLFELPARLNTCVQNKAYEQAVSYYARASDVLNRYKEEASFRSIYTECTEIITRLKAEITASVSKPTASQREVVDGFALLLRLRGDAGELCDSLLLRAKEHFLRDCDKQDRTFAFIKGEILCFRFELFQRDARN
jgi:hypothetical protein